MSQERKSLPLTEAERITLIALLRKGARKGLIKGDKPSWLFDIIEGGKK